MSAAVLPEPLRAVCQNALGAIVAARPLGGGSIARRVDVITGNGRFFVKHDHAGRLPLYRAEADGLAALAACPAIRVPAMIGMGCAGSHAYLILEYLDLAPLAPGAAAAAAGAALAEVHRLRAQEHGWPDDNFIGNTPQHNRAHADWAAFYAQRRLAPQLAIAERQFTGPDNACLIAAGHTLLARLPALLAGHAPVPSLVHGDLWHGNVALDAHGRLTLFDPAVHYGDRECDLAMSALFGGFPIDFYTGYRDAWPLPDGHRARAALYRLYHVLNHYNLFGSSYRAEAGRLIAELLAP